MEIVETSVFTRQIRGLLRDDEYKELQERLVMNPLAGAVIPGSGGCGSYAGVSKVAARAAAYG